MPTTKQTIETEKTMTFTCRAGWMEDLADLLSDVANSDVYTDASECEEAVQRLQERAQAWREVLIVEGLVK